MLNAGAAECGNIWRNTRSRQSQSVAYHSWRPVLAPGTSNGPRYISSDPQDTRMEQYIRCVESCNRGIERRSEFLSFLVDTNQVGYVHPSFAKYLKQFHDVFGVEGRTVQINQKLRTPEDRTNAVEDALRVLRDTGHIPGWRNEHYPVVTRFDSPPLFSMERAAVPFFGTKAYGIHMNGFVSLSEKKLWVATRSKSKPTYPGLLDHLVAGGQPVGLTCEENLTKECDEEAGIPKVLAQRAIPVGAVSYENIQGDQYKRDVLFCYDLELPQGFEPFNRDGEVESFQLDSIPNVMEKLHMYKPNCSLVVIDFLFRHGYIRPEEEGYLHLYQSLRNGECF